MNKKSIPGLVLFLLVQLSLISHTEAQNSWLQRANFGGGNRMEACAFSIADKGYILTGQDGPYYNDVWVYDTTLNSWSQLGNFPGAARFGASAASLNGNGFVIGGNSGAGFMNDCWEYFPGTDSWSLRTSFPGSARYFAVAIADTVSHKIYYGTGDDGNSIYLNDWWAYDPALNTWTSLTPFPGGQRSYGTGFAINGVIYVGTGNDNGPTAASTDWWKYYPGTNSWSAAASLPASSRRDACTFVIGSKGYVSTGQTGVGPVTDLSDLWMYDPTLDSWSSRANYGGGQNYTAVAFSIGNKGYLGTGNTGTATNIFWEYTPFPADVTTGIQDRSTSASVVLYPNPSNGSFILKYSGPDLLKAEFVVTDATGREVIRENAFFINQRFTSDHSGELTSGIYFYRLLNGGELIASGKLSITK